MGKISNEVNQQNIIPVLLNPQSKNTKERMDNGPYRNWLDLVVCYDLLTDETEKARSYAYVTDSILEETGLDEEGLFQSAMDNLGGRYKVEISYIAPGSYCLQFEDGLYGGSIVLLDSYLKQMAEKISDDLFIMPISVHELVVVKKKSSKPVGELKKILKSINKESPTDEILSDKIYLFNRKRGKITVAC